MKFRQRKSLTRRMLRETCYAQISPEKYYSGTCNLPKRFLNSQLSEKELPVSITPVLFLPNPINTYLNSL